MTKNDKADLLGGSGNYAAVQLPGRNFPGVLIQGDTLQTILQNLDILRNRFEDLIEGGETGENVDEIKLELEDLKDQLGKVL